VLLDGARAVDIGVEISLYPFTSGHAPYIHAFIDRLRQDARLRVETSSMSTQIYGSYADVFAALQTQLHDTFVQLGADGHKAVLVMKVMGPLASA
jgi:uncharacterized protein YqgV (UPF0045/DUF77 family)